MSFKTILVHLDNEAQSIHLLKAAVRLAGQYEAHLIGTYIAHTAELYHARASEIAMSAEITNLILRGESERANSIQHQFETATNAQNLLTEWRFDPNYQGSLESDLLDQAKYADVLMISADYKELPNGMVHKHVATLITHCSRPTIVVPSTYHDNSLGDHVFVAWDGSRESSRAVFDALPLLQTAKNVWLHRVISSVAAQNQGENATRDLADALARHGVNLEVSDSVSSARKVGTELLGAAGSRGADCIVMGAYGHSRIHEMLLGGVTRHILAKSTVPLIMSR